MILQRLASLEGRIMEGNREPVRLGPAFRNLPNMAAEIMTTTRTTLEQTRNVPEISETLDSHLTDTQRLATALEKIPFLTDLVMRMQVENKTFRTTAAENYSAAQETIASLRLDIAEMRTSMADMHVASSDATPTPAAPIEPTPPCMVDTIKTMQEENLAFRKLIAENHQAAQETIESLRIDIAEMRTEMAGMHDTCSQPTPSPTAASDPAPPTTDNGYLNLANEIRDLRDADAETRAQLRIANDTLNEINKRSALARADFKILDQKVNQIAEKVRDGLNCGQENNPPTDEATAEFQEFKNAFEEMRKAVSEIPAIASSVQSLMSDNFILLSNLHAIQRAVDSGNTAPTGYVPHAPFRAAMFTGPQKDPVQAIPFFAPPHPPMPNTNVNGNKGKGKETRKPVADTEKPAVRKGEATLPPKPTWAQVAQAATPQTPARNGASTTGGAGAFTKVESRRSRRRARKQAPAPPKTNPGQDKAALVHFDNPVKAHDQPATALEALTEANVALAKCGKNTPAPFLRANFTSERSLVLATGFGHAAKDYETHLDVVMAALSKRFGTGKARICVPWSKFLVHTIPTSMSLEEISAWIVSNYPKLRMGQAPRWLTSIDRRANKDKSTVVITLEGTHTLETLGMRSMSLRNKTCRMEAHVGYGPATQCRHCQGFGHHTTKCQSTSGPICAVCAGKHPTRRHPCSVPACRKGPACKHTPPKCANCGGAHRAYDTTCPKYVSPTAVPRTVPIAGQHRPTNFTNPPGAHAPTHTEKIFNAFPDTTREVEMEL